MPSRRQWEGFVVVAAAAMLLAACGPDRQVRSAASEAAHGVTNAFALPAGAVPQERGTDLRPAATSTDLKKSGGGTGGGGTGGGTGGTGGGTTGTATTLVLYDTTNTWGWMGELYGILVTNLATHFGPATAKPVQQYQPGDLLNYTATVYIGSTYDEPLPVAFLDDVLSDARPVIWIYDNIWQLANRGGTTFGTTYGFDPWMFDTSDVQQVVYKGQTLTRDPHNDVAGIMLHSPLDLTKVTVLGNAVRADGTTFPWGVRSSSRKLTYVGEIPFTYISDSDRYLIFCDLLFDALAPSTAARHRALVRIEDVNATDDPASLRAIADYLNGQNVPFAVALIPYYVDPNGVYNGGVPQQIHLKDAPAAFISALNYMVSKGGTILMHGWTHQYSNIKNPDSGVSGDDFEFWLAHIDLTAGTVVWDGPVPVDASAWAANRISSGVGEFTAAHFAAPSIFEFPHYAGSDLDAKAARAKFGTAYHRGFYFGGALTGSTANYAHYVGQFFPYVVTDLYGWKVLPENISNYEPDWYYSIPPRPVSVILANAQRNLVVRDGFASMYFHPFYDLTKLQELVSGVKALGYTFVSPASL